MTREGVLARTREYVRKSFLYTRPDFALDPDVELLGAGIIDSMGIMELIEFMEEEFSIQVVDDEITEENLGTLAAIGDYVARKTALPEG